MRIIELTKEGIPVVTGCAHNIINVRGYLGNDVATTQFEGGYVWCRKDEAAEIAAYWPGKYDDPSKVFI